MHQKNCSKRQDFVVKDLLSLNRQHNRFFGEIFPMTDETKDKDSEQVVTLSEDTLVEGSSVSASALEETKQKVEKLTKEGAGAPREVTAATIGRMMGLATTVEIKLLEGKIDLLSTRLNNLGVKLEKMSGLLQGAPTGSDLERIDVQIGSLRSMLRESLDTMQSLGSSAGGEKKKRSRIMSSEDSSEEKPASDSSAEEKPAEEAAAG